MAGGTRCAAAARFVRASPVGRSNRYRLARADLDQLATVIGTLEPGID